MSEKELIKSGRELTNWYTVKVQNNYERIVADRIQMEMDRIKREIKIVIPKERIITAKKGKKIFKDKMLYPGYIFVETEYVADLQWIIRGTTGATNVVSDRISKIPIKLRYEQVKSMLLAEEELTKPFSDILFVKGEHIKVLSGAFEGFNGIIDEIDIDNNKVKVLINIFKKATPVDLTLDDITKI